MDKNLKIAAVPLDIAWGDRDENLLTAGKLADKLPKDTDIAVFPELFATGFLHDANQMTALADNPVTHPSMDALRTISRRRNMAVCASLLYMPKPAVFVNRCVFIEPDGETTVYDKAHLFTLSREHRALCPGDRRPPVVRFRGWNISMAVCFDLRFPVWLRNTGLGYDVMLIPANWPVERQYAWQHLLIARAIENQAYMVGANRTGADDFGSYCTEPSVYDATGLAVAPGADGLFCLDKPKLDKVRHDMPFAESADKFSILLSHKIC